uniref:1-deoxy-D-xylulose-5-phosphate reductoisomerase n=1 Tax=Paenirhodobacter enshiensis TaxID=1105367 RepID=UPI0035AECC34
MRRVSVFGSTGSIGVNTLDLLERQGGAGAFQVVALTGGRNVDLLASQARALRADIAVTAYEECLPALRAALHGSEIEAAAGPAALIEAAERPADWIMSAIVGAAALAPGYAALRHGTTLALANKESMVAAGPLFLEAARRHGARLLPVDSEHSAVFQALHGEDMASVERVIITASGGAFRDWPMERIARATVAEASTHPNWAMGQRITIDSASMFNKGMELIEAKELFGLRPDQIEAVIHPESVIHALVGFRDGALMAHMGVPDMRHAIGYALNWPERAELPVKRLDLAALGSLSFRPADPVRYPALRLAREVMATGGLAGAVYNAAKEVALDGFIAGAIGFLDMAALVEQVLSDMSARQGLGNPATSLDEVLATDAEARALGRARIAGRHGAGRHGASGDTPRGRI